MKNQIVLGSFFGDEGKGATVQWLCKEAIEKNEKVIVARFSGGAQCGHRIIHNGIEHICSSFGSGVLLGIPTYLDENVYIDPISIRNEGEVLFQKTGKIPTLYINGNCRVTTPFDIVANREDKINLLNGSCGEGIYHTFNRYRTSEVFADQRNLAYALAFPRFYIEETLKFYKGNIDDTILTFVIEEFIDSLAWIKSNAKIVSNDMLLQNFVFSKYDKIIWEGSQGMLLDMDYGFMPHCTPSKTGLNGIRKEYLNNSQVFFVMRSYLTRHGNGYIPFGEMYVKDLYINLEEPTNRDDGYQGRFKVGVFDLSMLKALKDRHHLDNFKYHYNLEYNIVMNHLDCIEDTFYYTVDGWSMNKCNKDDLIDILKVSMKSIMDFNGFYAGYGQDNIKKV